MSKRITLEDGRSVVVFYVEDPQPCSQCGNVRECRPYGPEYSQICYECGMDTPKETHARMSKLLFAEDEPDYEDFHERMGHLERLHLADQPPEVN